MFNVRSEIIDAIHADTPIIVATIVDVKGSSPSPLGTSMVLTPHGIRDDLIEGTVVNFAASSTLTGGCIESQVIEDAQTVWTTGKPMRADFGISDGDGFALGLMCGGTLAVLIQRIDGTAQELARQLSEGTLSMVVNGSDEWLGVCVPRTVSELRVDGVTAPDGRRNADIAAQLVSLGQSAGASTGGPRTIVADCGGVALTVLTDSLARPPRMLIFGAVEYAVALSALAARVGYAVTVCDPREAFTTSARFPNATVVVEWPHRYLDAEAAAGRIGPDTILCILTHDLKFDLPLLERALETDAAYIGAMGSRRTQAMRRERLFAAGVSPEAWERVHAPIGLDLGATTPGETAISILAEIIAERHAADPRSLKDTSGAIHQA